MNKMEIKMFENSVKKAGEIICIIESADQSEVRIDVIAKLIFCHLGLAILKNHEDWTYEELLDMIKAYSGATIKRQSGSLNTRTSFVQ